MTVEKSVLSSLEVEEVELPCEKGNLGILKGHAPMVATLGIGVLKYRTQKTALFHKMVVSGGYVQVRGEDVVVLADFVETRKDINKEKIKTQLEALLNQLNKLNSSPEQTLALNRQEKKYRAILSLCN